MAECFFGTVSERDMDRMFLEAIVTDNDFARTIIDETKMKGYDFKILSVELSKTVVDLGESDITVIVEIQGHKYALLIEDKIDAVAMQNQSERYKLRGELGIQNGEYEGYETFIFCPEKYYNANDEAKKYDHVMSYEKHLSFFSGKSDIVSNLRGQQLKLAITKAKKPPQVTLNERAHSFFLEYCKYQKMNYPVLNMRTKNTSNGYWVQYGTKFGRAYIYHKIQEGYVDFTFPDTANKISQLQSVAEQLRVIGWNGITAVVTSKSAALRIEVPKLCMEEKFEATLEENIKECFAAILTLSNLAGFFWDIRSMEC